MDFGTTAVSYNEDRADGGFGWTVAYDLTLKNQTVEADLRVALAGDPPGQFRALWLEGVEAIWNARVFFAAKDRLYEVKLDLDFTSRAPHQTVQVHAGEGRTDMTNFYLGDSWGIENAGRVAAHEIGHMLGNFDEYDGGGTHAGFTRTGTLMSDLTVAGFTDYFWGVEFYAEQFGKLDFATVAAKRGSGRGETLTGGSGMDGIYGFGGNDLVRTGAGNDWVSGGKGNDVIGGGWGRDTLFGNAGRDVFVFDTAPNGRRNADRIEDFSAKDDALRLENAVFEALSKTGRLADRLFKDVGATGARADASDRVLYDRDSGMVSYDADGSGRKADAVLVAQLDAGTKLSAADFFIV